MEVSPSLGGAPVKMYGDKQPLEPRACERVESYISEFQNFDDVERVRKLYHDTADIDATMRLAISIKYANMKAKEGIKAA